MIFALGVHDPLINHNDSPKGGGEDLAVLLGQLPEVPDLGDDQPDDPAAVAARVGVELGVGGDVVVPRVGVVDGEPLPAQLLHLSSEPKVNTQLKVDKHASSPRAGRRASGSGAAARASSAGGRGRCSPPPQSPPPDAV